MFKHYYIDYNNKTLIYIYKTYDFLTMIEIPYNELVSQELMTALFFYIYESPMAHHGVCVSFEHFIKRGKRKLTVVWMGNK